MLTVTWLQFPDNVQNWEGEKMCYLKINLIENKFSVKKLSNAA